MRQPLDLNLAQRPFRNNTLLWVGYGAAFVLLAGFTGWMGLTYSKHTGLLDDLESRLSSIQSRSADLDRRETAAAKAIEAADLGLLETQSEKANQVIARKAFSWTQLFNRLEEIQPWEVRMNAIRPVFQKRGGGSDRNADPKKVEIMVEGTAKTFVAFTDFQNGIHADTRFGRVEPVSLKRMKTGEILFELRFFYDAQPEAEALPEGEVADADSPDAPAEDKAAAKPPAENEEPSEEKPSALVSASTPAAEGAAVQAASPAPSARRGRNDDDHSEGRAP